MHTTVFYVLLALPYSVYVSYSCVQVLVYMDGSRYKYKIHV